MKQVLLVWLSLVFAVTASAVDDVDLNVLNARGNTALANGDYVTAAYYFERIRNSDEWRSFNDRVGVLSKLAMLEERQSRSHRAAIWYGEIVDLYKETQSQERIDPAYAATFRYYALRYADSLERSGDYHQARRLLWGMYEESDPASRTMIVERLIRAYGFLSVTPNEIHELRRRISPDLMNSLGWPLARLYYTHNQLKESYELYESLWPDAPIEARNHIDSMLDVYREYGKVDHLLERVREFREAELGFDPFLLLEIALFRRLGRAEDALEALESDFARRSNAEQFESIVPVIGRVPSQVLDEYIDLVQRVRGDEAAMEILRQLVRHQPLDIHRRDRLSAMLARSDQAEEAIQLWTEWSNVQNNQPAALLHAAGRIHALGESEQASEMLRLLGDELSPDLLLQRGLMGLRLNDFSMAFASFHDARRSAQIGDVMISSEVLDFAQTAANVDAIFSALVDEASGVALAQLPPWISTLVQDLGFRPQFLPRFEALLDAEPSGAWRVQAAREAVNQGMEAWALTQLRITPENSPYHRAAEMEIALILSERSSIPAQREAASLLAKALEPILSATNGEVILPGMVPRLLDYAEVQLNAFQPAEAIQVIRHIESAMETFESPLDNDTLRRIGFYRARALMSLGSIPPALEYFESVQEPPYHTDALYFRALVHLSREETQQARLLLMQLVEDSEHWRRANAALELLIAMEPLVGQSMELFCLAQNYILQGRFADAEPVFRELAVREYGEDMEEWSRFWIGRMRRYAGNVEGARAELERLLMDVDHPLIHGMIRMELLVQSSEDPDLLVDMNNYQQLLLDFPDSLFADLARLRMQGQLESMRP